MTTWKIEQNDILSWCKRYDGPPAHALLCDAPYHLVSTVKRFGPPNSKPPSGEVFKRVSKGMMGATWDGLGSEGKGISFDPETWAALAEHLYPGAFGMTFASPRTHHRIACAIEDAGMIIQPTFYCWLYLSGFPKATRVKGYGSPTFSGHRYGGQAIKPAVEPVIIFQKPYEGRPVDSIVATGAGALNIDGGRIGADTSRGDRYNGKSPKGGTGYGGYEQMEKWEATPGRWPSNFLLQHHPDDNGECHPDCPVRLFDEQAGVRISGRIDTANQNVSIWGGQSNREGVYEADSGPASRMFYQASFEYESIEANAPLMKLRNGLSEREKLYVTEELKKAGVL